MFEVLEIRNRCVSEIVVGFISDKEFNEDYNMGDVEVVIEELLEVLEVRYLTQSQELLMVANSE